MPVLIQGNLKGFQNLIYFHITKKPNLSNDFIKAELCQNFHFGPKPVCTCCVRALAQDVKTIQVAVLLWFRETLHLRSLRTTQEQGHERVPSAFQISILSIRETTGTSLLKTSIKALSC